MAVYTPKRLSQSQPGTSYATAYTIPASTSCIIKELVVCNTTANNVTLDVSLVASGGTAGVTNNVIAQHSIAAYSMVIYTLSQVMATGGFVSMKAGTASALTVTISGVEFV
jgi:hypothetical protein